MGNPHPMPICPSRDSIWTLRLGQKPAVGRRQSTYYRAWALSGLLNGSFLYQQVGDGVGTPAYRAFELLGFRVVAQRRFALGTDEDLEEFGVEHGVILARGEIHRRNRQGPPSYGKGRANETWRTWRAQPWIVIHGSANGSVAAATCIGKIEEGYDRGNGTRDGAMAATLLDGNQIANEIKAETAAEVRAMAAAGICPGLAVVLVGHNPASEIYVSGKVKACQALGIYS